MKKLLVQMQGGMGKQIVGTGVVKHLAEQNPGADIHVLTSYPDMFRMLPFVGRTFVTGQPLPYFREDHADYEILAAEPYTRLSFRRGEEHLSQAWTEIFGMDSQEQPTPGIIKLTDQEHEAAMRLLGQLDRSKTWVAFQPWGGTSYHDPNAAMDPLRPRQARNLPFDIAQEIVNKLTEQGKMVIQFSLPTERRLENAVPLDLGVNQQTNQPNILPPRVLFAVLNLCQEFVGIDSAMQHAWVALDKKGKSVVLWGATNPKCFSYPQHVDLSGKCPGGTDHCGRPDTALPDIVDGGHVWTCPHGERCMNHNPESVIQALSESPPD